MNRNHRLGISGTERLHQAQKQWGESGGVRSQESGVGSLILHYTL